MSFDCTMLLVWIVGLSVAAWLAVASLGGGGGRPPGPPVGD